MKHKWIIKPRGKITKCYICSRCGKRIIASSIKIADLFSGFCKKENK